MKLLEKAKIGNLELRNRVISAPISVDMSGTDFLIDEALIAFYEERAKNGLGMIISVAFAIDHEMCGRIQPGQNSIFVPGQDSRLRELIERVHAQGCKITIQLLHPGRQGYAGLNWGQQPVAPSAINECDGVTEMPRELTNAEIKILRDKFIHGAKIAYDCGADGVELHAAHGYLIHNFLGERSNQRTDEYGGSHENRMRFIYELINGINAIKPKKAILGARLNVYDGCEGGMTVEEGTAIIRELSTSGLDYIAASNSTYTNNCICIESSLHPEGVRSDYLKPITESVNIPIIACNNIKRPETAEQMLQDGVVDFVLLGRPLFADSEWISKTQAGHPEKVRNCISCFYCSDTVGNPGGVRCSLNPRLGREYVYNDKTMRKDGNGRKVVVIGAGPGGMQTAITAAKRGFDVTLFDKGSELGGTMILASKSTGKNKITTTLKAFGYELQDLGVDVRLNTEITSPDEIASLNPYAVIVACGAHPVRPPFEGVDKPHVVLAHDVLKNSYTYTGKKIALIGGGMTGLETVETLIGKDNDITVYEMLDQVAKIENPMNAASMLQHLTPAGVKFKTLHKLKAIKDSSIVVENMATGEEAEDSADVVILSLGVKPNTELREMLEGKFDNLYFIGDCADGVRIAHATRQGFDLAWNL